MLIADWPDEVRPLWITEAAAVVAFSHSNPILFLTNIPLSYTQLGKLHSSCNHLKIYHRIIQLTHSHLATKVRIQSSHSTLIHPPLHRQTWLRVNQTRHILISDYSLVQICSHQKPSPLVFGLV